MRILTGLVSAVVAQGHERIRVPAEMLGYPSKSNGKPDLVEVRLHDGRVTTSRFEDVVAVDDDARALLRGGPAK